MTKVIMMVCCDEMKPSANHGKLKTRFVDCNSSH